MRVKYMMKYTIFCVAKYNVLTIKFAHSFDLSSWESNRKMKMRPCRLMDSSFVSSMQKCMLYLFHLI